MRIIPCMQPRRLKSCKVQTWPLCGLTPGNARNTEWKLGRDVLSGICIWRSIRAWNLMFLPNVQLWGSVSVEPLKAWPRGGHDSACFCVQCWSHLYSCNLTSPWSDHVGVIFTSTMSAGKRSSSDLVVHHLVCRTACELAVRSEPNPFRWSEIEHEPKDWRVIQWDCYISDAHSVTFSESWSFALPWRFYVAVPCQFLKLPMAQKKFWVKIANAIALYINPACICSVS